MTFSAPFVTFLHLNEVGFQRLIRPVNPAWSTYISPSKSSGLWDWDHPCHSSCCKKYIFGLLNFPNILVWLLPHDNMSLTHFTYAYLLTSIYLFFNFNWKLTGASHSTYYFKISCLTTEMCGRHSRLPVKIPFVFSSYFLREPQF